MKPVLFYAEARLELIEAIDYYECIRHELAADLEEEVRHALGGIRAAPEMWNLRRHGTRCRLLPRFPYALHYLLTESSIWIVAFAHVRRKPYYWRKRIV